MIETVKTLILDFQEEALVTGIPRRLSYEFVKKKAFVCIGVRRCGKSTLLFQIVDRLLADGVPRENILYLNFFDDRLHALRHGDLGVVMEAYYSLYPTKKNRQTVYCFFDEIQMVEAWEPFVDRILRTERCEVFITGSSSKMLSKEIATQMRGRSISWELFPFSFREYLDAKGVEGKLPLSTRNRLLVQKAFEDYWEKGGFPETFDMSPNVRTRIHQEYFTTILFRDLIERHEVAHPKAVTDLAYRLIDNIASSYTINSLTGYLKSLGHKTSKTQVASLMEWFEDAYFLFTVRIFDPSLSRQNSNPKRIYCVDHALVTSVASGILVNSGHLLENLVFVALRQVTRSIHYYRTRSGKEVDFIWRPERGNWRLIQVCESLADSETRKRELASLAEAMRECNIHHATVVTRRETEQTEVDSMAIDVVPAWRFLLETPKNGEA